MGEIVSADMGIAELAARANVTPRTIRYYVAEGLLPPPGGAGQRRSYGQEHLQRLELIRELKAAYLPLHEIRRRLGAPPASGDSVRDAVPPVTSAARMDRPEQTPGAVSSTVLPGGVHPGDAPRISAVAAVAGTSSTASQRPPHDIAPASAGAVPAASRSPIGFGGSQSVGRIEIFEPPETVWRRFVLAPGVELHYRETDDPVLAEAIQRLIREAPTILDARQPRAPGQPPGTAHAEGGG